MTEPLFFDTDCISAFLWVDNESILSKLFPGRIIIPKEVYDELSHPGVNRVKGLKAQVDLMLQAGDAIIETITVGTEAYELYRKLTNHPDPGHKIIGRGEAASISLAKENHLGQYDCTKKKTWIYDIFGLPCRSSARKVLMCTNSESKLQ